MKRLFAAMTICLAAIMPTVGSAFADNVHPFIGSTGQPDAGGSIVNCGGTLNSVNGQGQIQLASTAGQSNPVNSKGSPFGPTAFAGTKYAGSQPQNSKSPTSISQYDVACFQATMHQKP
jgi:hypothetical protein